MLQSDQIQLQYFVSGRKIKRKQRQWLLLLFLLNIIKFFYQFLLNNIDFLFLLLIFSFYLSYRRSRDRMIQKSKSAQTFTLVDLIYQQYFSRCATWSTKSSQPSHWSTSRHLVLHLDASCWTANQRVTKKAREEFIKSCKLMDQITANVTADILIWSGLISIFPNWGTMLQPALESNLHLDDKATTS